MTAVIPGFSYVSYVRQWVSEWVVSGVLTVTITGRHCVRSEAEMMTTLTPAVCLYISISVCAVWWRAPLNITLTTHPENTTRQPLKRWNTFL